jgi:surface antigen
MTISAMKQALEALEEVNEISKGPSAICLPAEIDTAMDALRQAIAEAEKQEPVAWHEPDSYGNVTTYKDWALANGWLPLYKDKNT